MAKNLRTKPRYVPRRRNKNALDVFINCPFDEDHQPIFNATVFTVVRSGYRARCALETDDAAQNRLGKIVDIIGECRYGIHDISRTQTSGDPPLPRFNMPLELGLWLGAHYLGGDDQAERRCIIFDTELHRYQRFISDIGGQDVHAHSRDVGTLIAELSAWLRHLPGGVQAGGGQSILREYRDFETMLPSLCDAKNMTPEELLFADYNLLATEFVASLKDPPGVSNAITSVDPATINPKQVFEGVVRTAISGPDDDPP